MFNLETNKGNQDDDEVNVTNMKIMSYQILITCLLVYLIILQTQILVTTIMLYIFIIGTNKKGKINNQNNV
jgi:hypothetical protein